jgi:hypothetical protein
MVLRFIGRSGNKLEPRLHFLGLLNLHRDLRKLCKYQKNHRSNRKIIFWHNFGNPRRGKKTAEWRMLRRWPFHRQISSNKRWARLVAWAEIVHHWRSEMGVPAR